MTAQFQALLAFIGQWITAWSTGLATDVASFANIAYRELLPVSQQSAGVRNGSRIRLTLSPPAGATNSNIGACYVGHKGASAPNFDGNQVQVTFGGSGTVTLTGGSGDTVSDIINFNFDSTKDLIVSFWMSNTTSSVRVRSGGNAAYQDYENGSGSAAIASATTASGYGAANNGQTLTISKVEVFG